MEENTLNGFQCNHDPKKVKLKIDGGANEIFHLILCLSCYANQKPNFIIGEEIIH